MREAVEREDEACRRVDVDDRWVKSRQPIDRSTLPRARSEFTYLDIASIDNTFQRIYPSERVSRCPTAPSRRSAKRVRAGDVLFSNRRTYLKNIASVCPEVYRMNRSHRLDFLTILRGKDGVLSRYLFYYCLTNSLLSGLSELAAGERAIRAVRVATFAHRGSLFAPFHRTNSVSWPDRGAIQRPGCRRAAFETACRPT